LISIKQQQQIEKLLSSESSSSSSSSSKSTPPSAGSTEKGMVKDMVANPSLSTVNSPVVIKLNKTEFEEIDSSQFRKAPEFRGVTGYINTNASRPLDLHDLRGNVVLVDLWTYSCINCIRTIPYLNDWYEKYSDQGLIIVGVHTPEFEFEKNFNNVKSAVDKFGIKYPVIQDNNKEIWNAYENKYWPRKYIIDTEGNIRYDHIGEGAYPETEKVIQYLLAKRAAKMGKTDIMFSNSSRPVISPDNKNSQYSEIDFSKIKTPEIYLGYQLARAPLGNPQNFQPDRTVAYSIPSGVDSTTTNFKPSIVYLEGRWKNNPDNIELQSDTGRIILNYSAKSVNIVAGGTPGTVGKVSIDNFKNLNGHISSSSLHQQEKDFGTDISKGTGEFSIDGQRLYNLINDNGYGEHVVNIDVRGKGFRLYTFTFG
jgi:thiol-disulfide isomerase/thioredoxin